MDLSLKAEAGAMAGMSMVKQLKIKIAFRNIQQIRTTGVPVIWLSSAAGVYLSEKKVIADNNSANAVFDII